MTPITISSGVSSTGLYIGDSAVLDVESGGSVTSSIIRGVETISAGASSFNDVMDGRIVGGGPGGQHLYGIASDTILHSNGEQGVYSGGVSYYTRVESGGQEVVNSSGVAISTVADGGGLAVDGGGIASAALVMFGAVDLYGSVGGPDGVAIGTIVGGPGAYIIAFSGGVTSDAIVHHAGEVELMSGGSSVDSFLHGGGEIISSGGVASGTRVSSGGYEVVSSGGESIGTYVYSGGREWKVYGEVGQTAIDDLTVSSGGVFEWSNFSGGVSGLLLRPGAEILTQVKSVTAVISGGVLELIASGGSAVLASATLRDGGAGLALTVKYIGDNTDIYVTSATSGDGRPALLAQSLAGFGGAGTLAGSSASHGGVTSALVEVLKPR